MLTTGNVKYKKCNKTVKYKNCNVKYKNCKE